MKRRRLISAIVGVLLAFVMAAMAFVGPGIRHTHVGGDRAHSHSGSRADTRPHDSAATHSHSHGPGGHVHSHSHGTHTHSHGHPRTDETTHDVEDDAEVQNAHSHVHISFLWFELNLPDFLDGDETVPSATGTENVNRSGDASTNDTVTITGPFTLTQLVQVLLLPLVPLPNRTVLPEPDCIGFLLLAHILDPGRLSDAPELPPPEVA